MKILMGLVTLLVRVAPLHFLIASIGEIGWSVSVEKDGEMVEGLTIGTDEYIDRHTPKKRKKKI